MKHWSQLISEVVDCNEYVAGQRFSRCWATCLDAVPSELDSGGAWQAVLYRPGARNDVSPSAARLEYSRIDVFGDRGNCPGPAAAVAGQASRYPWRAMAGSVVDEHTRPRRGRA